MGNNQGAMPVNVSPAASHSPIPEDAVPYTGPAIEYRIVQIMSRLKAHMAYGFTSGQPVASSDVQAYYNNLQQQYVEFFRMNTFFQVPMATQSKSMFSSSSMIPFQGIVSRPAYYIPSPEKWQLRVEQSAIQMSRLTYGSVFTMGRPIYDENLSDICNKINQNAQAGGKLICMECSGNNFSQSQGWFRTYQSPFYGVDIFFDMPLHPNPTKYSYTIFSAPMNIQYDMSNISVFCDWNGILKQHLDQGWKLVDVFIAQHETGMLTESYHEQNRRSHFNDDNFHSRMHNHNHYNYRPSQINTVWFFEKEISRAQDLTPRYQATMVEYYLQYSHGMTSTQAYLDLSNLLTEMGRRGWELVCVLDTPQERSNGMFSTSGTRYLVIFFQRPLQPQTAMPPQAQHPPGQQSHNIGFV